MADRIGPEVRAKIERAWQELLGAVAAGSNIGEACARAGVTRGNVYAYQRENPQARAEWEMAREESADSYADLIASILNNPGDPQIARVRVDGYKWLASKRNPRVYSDKQTLDVTVKSVDLTRIIQDANARLAASRSVGRIVEGAVITAALPRSVDELL